LIWFKTIVSKEDHFRFEEKTLGRRKTIWFGLEIVSGKTEHNYLIQNLIDQSKTFWFCPEIISAKSERFYLIHVCSHHGKASNISSHTTAPCLAGIIFRLRI
jgi:hypothetical protein